MKGQRVMKQYMHFLLPLKVEEKITACKVADSLIDEDLKGRYEQYISLQ